MSDIACLPLMKEVRRMLDCLLAWSFESFDRASHSTQIGH